MAKKASKQVVNEKNDLVLKDSEILVRVVEDLQRKLEKKNRELTLARTKLRVARMHVVKLKDRVKFQRERIIELHTTTHTLL